jgi:hypothetical protein
MVTSGGRIVFDVDDLMKSQEVVDHLDSLKRADDKLKKSAR